MLDVLLLRKADTPFARATVVGQEQAEYRAGKGDAPSSHGRQQIGEASEEGRTAKPSRYVLDGMLEPSTKDGSHNSPKGPADSHDGVGSTLVGRIGDVLDCSPGHSNCTIECPLKDAEEHHCGYRARRAVEEQGGGVAEEGDQEDVPPTYPKGYVAPYERSRKLREEEDRGCFFVRAQCRHQMSAAFLHVKATLL